MKILKNFIKGIIAGIGGVAPGLSGSVLMVLLGVYEKTVQALGTLFRNFKDNVRFLIPLFCGMLCGVLLFSRAVEYALEHFEFYTRYLFLGLVLGTIPLFFRQVRKNGLRMRHYVMMLCAAAAGLALFVCNGHLFTTVEDPNFLQSMLMGLTVAGSSIIPGVDSAVILSTLGFYELYVGALAQLDFAVLLPAGIGLLVGVIVISTGMNFLLKRAYSATFSILFGLFVSIIPNVLNENCAIGDVEQGIWAGLCVVLGCGLSYYLGDVYRNNAKIKRAVKKLLKKE